MFKKINLFKLFILVLILFSFLFSFSLEDITQNFVERKKIDTFFHKKEKTNQEDEYIMILEIPKIKVKKGIYAISSKYNSVNYGIELLKNSHLPNEEGSTLFLASHSGNSAQSYFKHLDHLEKNDIVNIYFNQFLYTYSIYDFYEIEKNGFFKFYKKEDKEIVLITCKNHDPTKQIVYIGKLIKVENFL